MPDVSIEDGKLSEVLAWLVAHKLEKTACTLRVEASARRGTVAQASSQEMTLDMCLEESSEKSADDDTGSSATAGESSADDQAHADSRIMLPVSVPVPGPTQSGALKHKSPRQRLSDVQLPTVEEGEGSPTASNEEAELAANARDGADDGMNGGADTGVDEGAGDAKDGGAENGTEVGAEGGANAPADADSSTPAAETTSATYDLEPVEAEVVPELSSGAPAVLFFPGEPPTTESHIDEAYRYFNLKVYYEPLHNGLEESVNFPIDVGTTIADRYRITDYLGAGVFSRAVQCVEIDTGRPVCIKIIRNNKDFLDQGVGEVKLLQYLNEYDPDDTYHVLRMIDYFYFKEHLFIVTELLRDNLFEMYKYIAASDWAPYFTLPRMRLIAHQALRAIAYTHALSLIHCDLKPENILIKSLSRCQIKVIDFGSSCFFGDPHASYVQSRSYRAPEVLLGLPYTAKIDLWSLGCILAELFIGKVLFANKSVVTLLASHVSLCGDFPEHMVDEGKHAHLYFHRGQLYQRDGDDDAHYLRPRARSFSQTLNSDDELFIDFLSSLLTLDPDQRPSAEEALRHPWFTKQAKLPLPDLYVPEDASGSSSPLELEPAALDSTFESPFKAMAAAAAATEAAEADASMDDSTVADRTLAVKFDESALETSLDAAPAPSPAPAPAPKPAIISASTSTSSLTPGPAPAPAPTSESSGARPTGAAVVAAAAAASSAAATAAAATVSSAKAIASLPLGNAAAAAAVAASASAASAATTAAAAMAAAAEAAAAAAAAATAVAAAAAAELAPQSSALCGAHGSGSRPAPQPPINTPSRPFLAPSVAAADAQAGQDAIKRGGCAALSASQHCSSPRAAFLSASASGGPPPLLPSGELAPAASSHAEVDDEITQISLLEGPRSANSKTKRRSHLNFAAGICELQVSTTWEAPASNAWDGSNLQQAPAATSVPMLLPAPAPIACASPYSASQSSPRFSWGRQLSGRSDVSEVSDQSLVNAEPPVNSPVPQPGGTKSAWAKPHARDERHLPAAARVTICEENRAWSSVPTSPTRRRAFEDAESSKKTPVQFRVEVAKERLQEAWTSKTATCGGANSSESVTTSEVSVNINRVRWKIRAPRSQQYSPASSPRSQGRPSGFASLIGSGPESPRSGPQEATQSPPPSDDVALLRPPPMATSMRSRSKSLYASNSNKRSNGMPPPLPRLQHPSARQTVPSLDQLLPPESPQEELRRDITAASSSGKPSVKPDLPPQPARSMRARAISMY